MVPSDPTMVAVKVTDAVSGFSEGAIEISAVGLRAPGGRSTRSLGRASRLLARVDDAWTAARPVRAARASARDLARNEASTTLRSGRAADGRERCRCGWPRGWRSASRGRRSRRSGYVASGKRRSVRRRADRVQSRAGAVRLGRQARISRAGSVDRSRCQGIAGARSARCYATTGRSAPSNTVAAVVTDADQSGAYVLRGGRERQPHAAPRLRGVGHWRCHRQDARCAVSGAGSHGRCAVSRHRVLRNGQSRDVLRAGSAALPIAARAASWSSCEVRARQRSMGDVPDGPQQTTPGRSAGPVSLRGARAGCRHYRFRVQAAGGGRLPVRQPGPRRVAYECACGVRDDGRRNSARPGGSGERACQRRRSRAPQSPSPSQLRERDVDGGGVRRARRLARTRR